LTVGAGLIDAFKTKLVDIAKSNMRLPDRIADPLKRIFEQSGNSGLGLKHECIAARVVWSWQ
jgi:hypothetical protein